MKHTATYIIATLLAFSAKAATAQTFTQQLQRQRVGEGTVTLHEDKSIDDLVNGKKAAVSVQASPEAKTANPAEADTLAKSHPKGVAYKVNGYRVQVYAGGNSRQDKQRATAIGTQLKALFPEEAVYVKFFSPRWTCRIGNYETYEEAHEMQQKLKQLDYRSATLIKAKVTIQH